MAFYTTYKELKRYAIAKDNHVILPFYTTYKELKLKNRKDANFWLTSFYTTYKELKRIHAQHRRDVHALFTLPIRNWNFF